MQRIDIVDILLPFIHFPLHPMSIKIAEKMVDVLRRGGVSVPFSNVEAQQSLVGVRLGFVIHISEMSRKVAYEVVVEIFSQEVS